MNAHDPTIHARGRRLLAAIVSVAALTAFGCQPPPKPGSAPAGGAPSANLGASASVKDLMAARGLSESDVESALKTYMPTGKKDDYLIFASGGQSGQVLVLGVPSMLQPNPAALSVATALASGSPTTFGTVPT